MDRTDETLVHFCQSRGGVVELPAGLNFPQARFERRNVNLIIENVECGRVFVRNFFDHKVLPLLRTQEGDEMSGSLAAAFVTLSERTLSALIACGMRPANEATSAVVQSMHCRPSDKG